LFYTVHSDRGREEVQKRNETIPLFKMNRLIRLDRKVNDKEEHESEYQANDQHHNLFPTRRPLMIARRSQLCIPLLYIDDGVFNVLFN